jgi:hypothetical protein
MARPLNKKIQNFELKNRLATPFYYSKPLFLAAFNPTSAPDQNTKNCT